MSWQVKVMQDEAASAGLSIGSHPNKWGQKLRPILASKGVPDAWLYTGSLKVRPVHKAISGGLLVIGEWEKDEDGSWIFEVDDL